MTFQTKEKWIMEKKSVKKKMMTFALILALTASYAASPVFGVDVFAAESDEGVLLDGAVSVNRMDEMGETDALPDEAASVNLMGEEGVLSAVAASVNLLGGSAANTANGAVSVSAQTASVYAGADTTTEKVADVKQNDAYPYSEQKDGWYYIQIDPTHSGWIAASDVEAYILNENGSYTKQNEAQGSITVTSLLVNVRSGASFDYDVITQVAKDSVYRYYDVKDGWYYIQMNGFYGWISGDYAEAVANTAVTASPTTTTTAKKSTTTTAATTTTAKPSKDAVELKINNVSVERGGGQGKTTTIHIDAQGEELQYRWQYRDGTGAVQTSANTTDTYSAAVTKDNNGRRVWCVITDKYGNSKTTEDFYLSYIDITQSPADVRVNKGDTATFTVKAEGAGLFLPLADSRNRQRRVAQQRSYRRHLYHHRHQRKQRPPGALRDYRPLRQFCVHQKRGTAHQRQQTRD